MLLHFMWMMNSIMYSISKTHERREYYSRIFWRIIRFTKLYFTKNKWKEISFGNIKSIPKKIESKSMVLGKSSYMEEPCPLNEEEI